MKPTAERGARRAAEIAKRTICLDGLTIDLAVDRVELELAATDLVPADHPEATEAHRCQDGATCHPLMHFDDGTTIYLHCPPDGEDGPTGYHVSSPRPHRWNITFVQERVARLELDF